MRAVLVASGPGAGLSPLTGEIPAAMVPVLDRPLLGHTVDLLWRQGVDEIAVALGRRGDIVARHFGPALDYRRDERPLGAAGAVATCRELIGDGPFLAMSGEALDRPRQSTVSSRAIARRAHWRRCASGASRTRSAGRWSPSTTTGG